MKTDISKQLIEDLKSNDVELSSASEHILGVCRYPDNYWVMPDYYYPGLRSKLINKGDGIFSETSNDNVMRNAGLFKENEEYYSFLDVLRIDNRFDHEEVELKGVRLSDNNIFFETDNSEIKVPWDVFCAVFLKARELGFLRPDCLNEAGPALHKHKWLENQEKIKELQEKID